MNRKYLEYQIDNFTVGTHSISNELKDYLDDDYYCEDKVNDNLVLYSLDRNDKYGLVIDNEIIVGYEYEELYHLFKQKSKEIQNLPKSIQLLLEYGLTIKQAYEIHELIRFEISCE